MIIIGFIGSHYYVNSMSNSMSVKKDFLAGLLIGQCLYYILTVCHFWNFLFTDVDFYIAVFSISGSFYSITRVISVLGHLWKYNHNLYFQSNFISTSRDKPSYIHMSKLLGWYWLRIMYLSFLIVSCIAQQNKCHVVHGPCSIRQLYRTSSCKSYRIFS